METEGGFDCVFQFLAVALGFSRMYRDDLEQLASVMAIYDGFYRWARDATDETHHCPQSKPAS